MPYIGYTSNYLGKDTKTLHKMLADTNAKEVLNMSIYLILLIKKQKEIFSGYSVQTCSLISYR